MTGVRRGTEARGYGVYKASGGGAVRFVSHRTGTGKASGFPGSGKGGFSAMGLRPVSRLRKCPASNWAMETGRTCDLLLVSACKVSCT
jgi:hypothetical protein